MAANIKAGSKFRSALFQMFIIVSLISYWGFVTLIRPLSSYYKAYDPEIPYFMNSLAVFKGEPYYYLDHPGTPVELIGSAILAIFYFVGGGNSQSFISAQLQNPEPFFNITHLFITLASIACALLLFQSTISLSLQGKKDFLLATAVSLMFFAVHPLGFSTLTLWSHMSFNFPFGSLLLVLFWNSLKTRRELSSLTLAAYALAAGVLTATMIYFAAWIIGLIIFVLYQNENNHATKTMKAMFSVGIYSFLGFSLMLLPAAERIRYYIVWMINLSFHQGDYGSGEAGIITFSKLWTNLLDLISRLPLLSFFIMAAFILLLYTTHKNKHTRTPAIRGMAIALSIQLIVLLLFCLKHPGSDSFFNKRYALPVAATIPLLMLLVLQLVRPFERLYLISKHTIIILVFAGFSYNLVASIIKYDRKVEVISRSVEKTTNVINDYMNRNHISPQNLAVLWTYETFSRCYSLWFGNEYTGNLFSKELLEICGNQTALNIWNQSTLINDEWINVEKAQWDLIFARESVYSSYFFLRELGDYEEYFLASGNDDFDKYGHFIVIYRNTQYLDYNISE